MRAWTHAHECVCVCVCVCVCARAHTRTHTHAHARTRTHARTHTRTHAHTISLSHSYHLFPEWWHICCWPEGMTDGYTHRLCYTHFGKTSVFLFCGKENKQHKRDHTEDSQHFSLTKKNTRKNKKKECSDSPHRQHNWYSLRISTDTHCAYQLILTAHINWYSLRISAAFNNSFDFWEKGTLPALENGCPIASL